MHVNSQKLPARNWGEARDSNTLGQGRLHSTQGRPDHDATADPLLCDEGLEQREAETEGGHNHINPGLTGGEPTTERGVAEHTGL